jgi:hypothetical protein
MIDEENDKWRKDRDSNEEQQQLAEFDDQDGQYESGAEDYRATEHSWLCRVGEPIVNALYDLFVFRLSQPGNRHFRRSCGIDWAAPAGIVPIPGYQMQMQVRHHIAEARVVHQIGATCSGNRAAGVSCVHHERRELFRREILQTHSVTAIEYQLAMTSIGLVPVKIQGGAPKHGNLDPMIGRIWTGTA